MSKFRISEIPGVFEGEKLQGLWNGWERPVFNFVEAKKIAELYELSYDERTDSFEYDTEVFKAIYHNNEKMYPIGTDVWCWTEVSIPTLLREYIEEHVEDTIMYEGQKYDICTYHGDFIVLVDDSGNDKYVPFNEFYERYMCE